MLNRRSKEILELLLQGFGEESWKAELRTIEAHRTELEAQLASAKREPILPALHPEMATVFRHKTELLAAALAHEDLEERTAARSALRGFITRIVIPPEGLLMVEGDLGDPASRSMTCRWRRPQPRPWKCR